MIGEPHRVRPQRALKPARSFADDHIGRTDRMLDQPGRYEPDPVYPAIIAVCAGVAAISRSLKLPLAPPPALQC